MPGTPKGRGEGVCPPKSGPRMELTELPDRATPERGDGPGARGAAGGKTAGRRREGEGEPAGTTPCNSEGTPEGLTCEGALK